MIGYSTELEHRTDWAVRPFYSIGSGERRRSLNYTVNLDMLDLPIGGRRVYFFCVLFRNGTRCNNRVRKLRLPPGGSYFGCRESHDLTYRSCQESDSRFSRFRRNPALIAAAARNPGKMPLWMAFGVLNEAFRDTAQR